VETIRRAWCDRDVVTGRRVEARGGRGVVEGRAVGVNPAGSLVVQDGLGRLHTLVNDEVRILD
jgi:biotin-(acetyl-CoA carboxylase) ligase